MSEEQTRNFGKYVEQTKHGVSRGGRDNFSLDELRDIAEKFLQFGH